MAEFEELDEAAFVKTRLQNVHAEPRAVSARYDKRNDRIVVSLDNDFRFSFDPRHVRGLDTAPRENLTGVSVQGTGSTLHFPLLDADYSVSRLLERFLGPRDGTKLEALASASRATDRQSGRSRRVAGTAR